ncbi:unnamed protein product, partial [Symbiodinium pilosum]
AQQPDLSFQDERGETAWSLASLWGNKPHLFRSLRRHVPTSEPPSALLLFDGLLLRPVERVNRTLLSPSGGKDLEVVSHTQLTVEFLTATLWSWKQAGYMLHDAGTFFADHELCDHELSIQRVNGQPWIAHPDGLNHLRPNDLIKLKDRRQVRRLFDWQQEGWTVKAEGGDVRFCHSGAKKIQ